MSPEEHMHKTIELARALQHIRRLLTICGPHGWRADAESFVKRFEDNDALKTAGRYLDTTLGEKEDQMPNDKPEEVAYYRACILLGAEVDYKGQFDPFPDRIRKSLGAMEGTSLNHIQIDLIRVGSSVDARLPAMGTWLTSIGRIAKASSKALRKADLIIRHEVETQDMLQRHARERLEAEKGDT